ARLNGWLSNESAAPRLLITGPAGRGKSALLVQWMKAIHADPEMVAGWQFAFIPISVAAGTNLPRAFLHGLLQRIEEIVGLRATDPTTLISEQHLRELVATRLVQISESGKRILIVLDGIDEVPEGDLVPPPIPVSLPQNIRILCSARTQVHDSG